MAGLRDVQIEGESVVKKNGDRRVVEIGGPATGSFQTDVQTSKRVVSFEEFESDQIDKRKQFETMQNKKEALNVAKSWCHKAEERLEEAKYVCYQTIRNYVQLFKLKKSAPDCLLEELIETKAFSIPDFLTKAYLIFNRGDTLWESIQGDSDSILIANKLKTVRLSIIGFDTANRILDAAKASVKRANVELADAIQTFNSLPTHS